jgi:hypothetical protein
MGFRPQRYQCPKCRWDFAFRKKRCCPGCGTLLLIASDNATDADHRHEELLGCGSPRKAWDYATPWYAARTFASPLAYVPPSPECVRACPKLRRSYVPGRDGLNKTRFRRNARGPSDGWLAPGCEQRVLNRECQPSSPHLAQVGRPARYSYPVEFHMDFQQDLARPRFGTVSASKALDYLSAKSC